MRARPRASFLLLTACSSSSAPPPAEPRAAPTITNKTESCSNAAIGLERGTKSVRAPDTTVFEPMRLRCTQDAWPVDAIECFAKMTEGELGRCARLLGDRVRNAMFGVLGGGPPDRAALELTRARLSVLSVGVAECDRFVTAVSSVLACEAMPIEVRVQLGTETADFWDLPTKGLAPDAQQRMSAVCGESLTTLQAQTLAAGCAP